MVHAQIRKTLVQQAQPCLGALLRLGDSDHFTRIDIDVDHSLGNKQDLIPSLLQEGSHVSFGVLIVPTRAHIEYVDTRVERSIQQVVPGILGERSTTAEDEPTAHKAGLAQAPVGHFGKGNSGPLRGFGQGRSNIPGAQQGTPRHGHACEGLNKLSPRCLRTPGHKFSFVVALGMLMMSIGKAV